MRSIKTVITGTGSYIPPIIKKNKDFAVHNFYGEDNNPIKTDFFITRKYVEKVY